MPNHSLPKIIAFYLPQFHPVPENDEWWGPGFTEWHNVAKARPLFRGHVQPRLPGELGFYDLRLSETREAQAALAREYGVHGFCYWHYWFAGKRLLEDPLERVLASGKPDLPFCIGWANETWTGVWHGAPRRILMEQRYPPGDAEAHYAVLRRYFRDPRYIRDEGRPLLYVYKPRALAAEAGTYLQQLRALAKADGFPDLFVLGTWSPNPGGRFDDAASLDLDGAVVTNISGRDSQSKAHMRDAVVSKVLHTLRVTPKGPRTLPYAAAMEAMIPDPRRFPFLAYNCVISNWDNTPRSGRRGLVLTHGSARLFQQVLQRALELATPAATRPLGYVFLKSWNEWAEGNYVEPDQLDGRSYLEAIAAAIRAVTRAG